MIGTYNKVFNVFAVTLVLGLCWQSCAPLAVEAAAKTNAAQKRSTQPSPASRAEDEQTIRQSAQEYSKRFAAGDAKGISQLWWSDGSLVDETGIDRRGQGEIEVAFTELFNRTGKQPLEIVVESIKFVGDSAAVETGHARLPNSRHGTTTSYRAIHEKRDGKWRLANVIEVPAQDNSAPVTLKDVDWLVGDWTAKTARGTLEFTNEWNKTKTFIRSSLKGPDGDNSVQVIGWNPLLKQIVSWHFDSSGGFGQGKWTHEGSQWIVESRSMSPLGKLAFANYIIKPEGANSFQWQSVSRSFDGVQLPDTEAITVQRKSQ